MSVSDLAGLATRPRLGEILVIRRVITARQLDEALDRQESTGARLGRLLVSEGTISGTDLTDALVEQIRALGPPPAFDRGGRVFGGVARRLRTPSRTSLSELPLVLQRRARRGAARPGGAADDSTRSDERTAVALAEFRAEVNSAVRLVVSYARQIEDLEVRLADLQARLGPGREPPTAKTPRDSGRFLIFVPGGSGYRLVERHGTPPAVGEGCDVDGACFTVSRLGGSPLPGDGRVCAYLG